MKLAWREIEPFVKKPNPAARVVLVYGPDSGLMRERARAIAATVVSDISDPFNVAVLSTDILVNDPARLIDEANAISMLGGGRLVRVENAADKITSSVKIYLENPSPYSLVILEAGELTARSPLRMLCEKSPKAAALPCYVEDEQGLARLIRETLSGESLRADADAVTWLAASIGGDRARARGELEKLILYKGADKSPVTLEEARDCCGETGADSLDDLIYGIAGRQGAKAIAVYGRLMQEGVSFVAILRALQNHFRRLHVTRARMETGESADAAMKALTPPVFFKQEAAFRAQIQNWTMPALEKAMLRLLDLEADCKKTGAPVETLCAQAALGLASMR